MAACRPGCDDTAVSLHRRHHGDVPPPVPPCPPRRSLPPPSAAAGGGGAVRRPAAGGHTRSRHEVGARRGVHGGRGWEGGEEGGMVYAVPSNLRIQANGGSAPTRLRGQGPGLRRCRRGRQRRGGTTVSLAVTGRGASLVGERRGGTAFFFWLPTRPRARQGRRAHSPWTSPDARLFLLSLPTSPAAVCAGASSRQRPTTRCMRGAPRSGGAADPPRVGRHVSPHVSGGGHTLGVSATASAPCTVISVTTTAPPLHSLVRACAGRAGY